MDTKRICTLCGKALPASAPEGLCPECLLKAGIGSGVDIGTEPGANRTGFVPPAVAELAPLFPQLEILELIGKGGMGAVYRARQTQLNRLVALKILPPDVGHESAFAARFTREAQALASLNHPGIVTLYEFGQVARARTPLPAAGPQIDDAHPLPRPGSAGGSATQLSTVNPQTPLYFFLMEFVDGVNLRQLMHTGRVSAHAALAIVPQICDALQFAHDQGIVHRDIKPENVLLDRRGRVKVADFGLAKIVGGNQPLIPSLSPSDPSNGERVAKPGEASPAFTDAGKVMGTPNYMSPEQIEAPGEVDHRADIYALGVVFYQMLTGELPGKRIEPPSVKVHIDVRLDEVVLRALEKNPELRYQQASVFKTQVETIATTPPGAGGRQSAQTETAAGQSGQSLIEAAAPQKARLRWRTFGALRLHMMGHAPGKRRALWTWICSASSAALLFTLIMMAFHVRVALGRWPAFGEDYSTVLFRAHVYLLLGAWWFALVIATPLWILFLFLRPFRLGWRAHAAQAGLFGLGWLLIFIAAKYDPTPFTSWLLD